jgi:hypothetical protein
MLDLYEELKTLVTQLNRRAITYALCGGLALAVYGISRATWDIDLLIPEESLQPLRTLAQKLGYQIEAGWMNLSEGKVRIFRITKVDVGPDDRLPLDLVLVNPLLETVWDARKKVLWEGEDLWVVSREGLLAMKSIRGSGQDQDDIKNLRALNE